MRRLLYIILLLSLALTGCKKYYFDSTGLKTPDWTEQTHGKNVDPDYSVVFEEGKINKFSITISPSDWTVMQTDLKANVRPGNPAPPINDSWVPVYVPCSFKFNGKEWYKVGIRYKGNSSLRVCVDQNIKKYSFKLNFDHFEDDFPAIKNQRFYGFKELSLNNGCPDNSLMREKTAVDIFRESGVPSPRAVFCEIWVDYGGGKKYFGLYTLEEEVDNTVIKTQFSEGGNLYKPDGIAATFALGTYNTEQFYKKTNLTPVDYSDIKSLYNIINSGSRIINHNAWKSSLEEVFDVPEFLKWLAANTVMQDWDTYGLKHHNYYLYNNPVNRKLTWIPWDNNESLSPGGDKAALSLALDKVSEGWPLIRYILDDPDYMAAYKTNVSTFIQSPFSVSPFSARIDDQADLIKNYVLSEVQGYTFLSSYVQFEQAVLDLKQHVQNRADSVAVFLSK